MESLINRVQAEVTASMQRVDGPLMIGATPSLTLGLLPQVMGELANSYPAMTASIVEGLDGTLVPALIRAVYDQTESLNFRHPGLEPGSRFFELREAAGPRLRAGATIWVNLIASRSSEEIEILLGPVDPAVPRPADVVEHVLAREPFLIGMPHDHLFSSQSRLKLAELVEEAWVLPSRGSSFHHVIEALFVAAGVRLPEKAITTNSLQLQERLVTATGRLCFLTPAQFIARQPLFKVAQLDNAPSRSIGMRYLAGMKLSPLAKAFIDQTRTIMAGFVSPEGLALIWQCSDPAGQSAAGP